MSDHTHDTSTTTHPLAAESATLASAVAALDAEYQQYREARQEAAVCTATLAELDRIALPTTTPLDFAAEGKRRAASLQAVESKLDAARNQAGRSQQRAVRLKLAVVAAENAADAAAREHWRNAEQEAAAAAVADLGDVLATWYAAACRAHSGGAFEIGELDPAVFAKTVATAASAAVAGIRQQALLRSMEAAPLLERCALLSNADRQARGAMELQAGFGEPVTAESVGRTERELAEVDRQLQAEGTRIDDAAFAIDQLEAELAAIELAVTERRLNRSDAAVTSRHKRQAQQRQRERLAAASTARSRAQVQRMRLVVQLHTARQELAVSEALAAPPDRAMCMAA